MHDLAIGALAAFLLTPLLALSRVKSLKGL